MLASSREAVDYVGKRTGSDLEEDRMRLLTTVRATCGVIGLFDILENESIFPRLAVEDRDRG